MSPNPGAPVTGGHAIAPHYTCYHACIQWVIKAPSTGKHARLLIDTGYMYRPACRGRGATGKPPRDAPYTQEGLRLQQDRTMLG